MLNNNRGVASGLLLMVLVASVIAGITMAAYSSFTTVTTNIQVDQRKKTDAKIAELIAKIAEFKALRLEIQELLAEVKSETSSIPRVCTPGDVECSSKCQTPTTCRHNFSNGKTVQSCEGDCTLVNGTWYKGGTACSLGMECLR